MRSLEALLGLFEPLLKKYARLLGDEDALPDLQLAFIRATKEIVTAKLENKSDGAIVNYYQSVVYHEYISLGKSRRAYDRRVLLIDDAEAIFSGSVNGANIQSSCDLGAMMDTYAQNLTELEIGVITDHYLHGYSIAEIAKKRKVSRQAVNKIKLAALAKLRANSKNL